MRRPRGLPWRRVATIAQPCRRCGCEVTRGDPRGRPSRRDDTVTPVRTRGCRGSRGPTARSIDEPLPPVPFMNAVVAMPGRGARSGRDGPDGGAASSIEGVSSMNDTSRPWPLCLDRPLLPTSPGPATSGPPRTAFGSPRRRSGRGRARVWIRRSARHPHRSGVSTPAGCEPIRRPAVVAEAYDTSRLEASAKLTLTHDG